MKKWTKLAIPVIAVAALVAWYAFRPERLVVNRRVDEALPTAQGGVSASLSNPGASTAFCTRREVPQPSSRWEMVFVFYA